MLCDLCKLITLRPPHALEYADGRAARVRSRASLAWHHARIKLGRKHESWGFYYKHQPSLEALRNSAENGGCQLCRLLYGCLKDPRAAGEGWPFRFPGSTHSEVRICRPTYESLTFLGPFLLNFLEIPLVATCGDRVAVLRRQMIDHVSEFGGSTGELRLFEGIDLASEECTNTGSAPSLALAKRWLDRCLTHPDHDNCWTHTDRESQPPLPTRVIDIGSAEPFLLVSSGRHGRYVALSHCWGSKQLITTTSQTISAHEAGIPISSLPRTFAEAIEVTRALSIQYLWIDSLCIVQDSREDWEAESAKMGDYYMNAHFTIAARHSSDSSQGLFRDREAAEIVPCPTRILVQNEFGKPRQVNVAWLSPAIQEGLDRRYDLMSQSPLDTRGWTLQERLLSPRLLTFGGLMLSFSCRQAEASENRPEGWQRPSGSPGGLSYFAGSRFIKVDQYVHLQRILWGDSGRGNDHDHSRSMALFPAAGRLRGNMPHLREIYSKFDAWLVIVQQYWSRRLTKDSDVLPAISGLAHRFFALGGTGRYLSGLWEQDLKTSLLWFSFTYSSRPKVEEGQTGPSWSWTSIRPVGERPELNFLNYTWLTDAGLTIVSATTTPKSGLDPFGEVTGGELKVRGRAYAAATRSDAVDGLTNSLQDPETHCVVAKLYQDVLPSELPSSEGYHSIPVTCVPVAIDMQGTIAPGQRGADVKDNSGCVVCLVLSQDPGDDGPSTFYRRIGIAAIYSSWYEKKSKEWPWTEMTIR